MKALGIFCDETNRGNYRQWGLSLLWAIIGIGVIGVMLVGAAPGDLDPTFDGDGKVVFALDEYLDPYVYAIALQPDQKIIVAHRVGNDIVLLRINDIGALDPNFGVNGIAVSTIANYGFTIEDIAFQADGKILLVGFGNEPEGPNECLLARFNADGSLDSSFGNTGMTTLAFMGGSHGDRCHAVAVQPDDKIVVGGFTYAIGQRVGLARFNADGSLDTTFSGDGIATDVWGYYHQAINDIVLQPDGKIIVAGYSISTSFDEEFTLARFNSNGGRDSSFSGDGRVITTITDGNDVISNVFLLPSGKIVAAGQANQITGVSTNDLAAARYNANGSLDTTFGSNGFTMTDIAGEDNRIRSATLGWDGKLILVFYTEGNFAAIRYTDEGTLDLEFGENGLLSTDIDNSDDSTRDALTQADGKFVIGGESYFSEDDFRTSLVRYATSTSASGEACNTPVALGNTNLTVQFEAPTCCNVTVEKFVTYPGGAPGDAGEMPIYWDITNDCTGSYNMTLSMCYTDGELEGGINITESNLVAFRNEGGPVWTNMGGVVDENTNCVTVSDVDELSYWTIGDNHNNPTALQLISFSGSNRVSWHSLLLIFFPIVLFLTTILILFNQTIRKTAYRNLER